MASVETKALLKSDAELSDSSVSVQLHPLAILSVSDCITRHVLRKSEGPIVGAILGQQSSHQVTMEVAFPCKTVANESGSVVFDEEWFNARLEQYKAVYKPPQSLELVGWFALGDSNGPQEFHLPIHLRLLEVYNDATLLLIFSEEDVAQGSMSGGKLPIHIYESVLQPGTAAEATDADADAMQVEEEAAPTQPADGAVATKLRFRRTPYTVETGEAEMIAMDFVAKGGGGNASIGELKPKPVDAQAPHDAKGKRRKAETEAVVDGQQDAPEPATVVLTPAEEELISTLTAKSNAIKMLHSRLRLLSAYLASLPPCYLNRDISDALSAVLTPDPPLDHTILRAIAAIVTRLRLVVPPSPADPLLPHSSSDTDKVAAVAVSTASLVPTASFAQQKSQQSCDVAVVEMLAAMTRLLQAASEVGRKHAVVRRNNPALKKSGLGLPPAMPSRGIDFWSQSAYSPGAFEDLSVSLASTSAPSKGA